jgi:hypothetical protein
MLAYLIDSERLFPHSWFLVWLCGILILRETHRMLLWGTCRVQVRAAHWGFMVVVKRGRVSSFFVTPQSRCWVLVVCVYGRGLVSLLEFRSILCYPTFDRWGIVRLLFLLLLLGGLLNYFRLFERSIFYFIFNLRWDHRRRIQLLLSWNSTRLDCRFRLQ